MTGTDAQAESGLGVGAVLDKHKMGNHYDLTITDSSFTYHRKEEAIATEACLDGVYVICTNVPKEAFSTKQVVDTCKSLALVERAFRCMKTTDLEIRSVFPWMAPGAIRLIFTTRDKADRRRLRFAELIVATSMPPFRVSFR